MLGRGKKSDALQAKDRPRESSGRVLAVKIVFILLFAIVALRLVQVQILDAPKYHRIAQEQYRVKLDLPATRGLIHDRSGHVLVSNTIFVSFAADPKIIDGTARTVAQRFSEVFSKPKASYLSKLSTPATRFVWLERRVDQRYASRVMARNLEGVIQMNEPRRLFHYDHLAGQLLGFTDIDNKGLSGIEYEFDDQLKGTSGFVIMQRDGLGRRRPSVDYPRVEPVNGKNIVLTIDLEYQAIVEEELRNGVLRNKAESGLAVMLEPATGEVLAMANYPPLNPNNPSSEPQSVMKNRVITDRFEPGSIFKIVTAAAALEAGRVRSDQKFFAERGRYEVTLAGGGKRVISDMQQYGMLTFQEGMEYSSNIVMAKASDLIGAESMYVMARNFGFGIATGLGLRGEVSGELKKPSQWSATTLNSIAFGYEVAVTPIQIAAAYAAVANNGILMRPYVLKQVVNENGDVTEERRAQAIRRVVSRGTAATLTGFLEGTVERGTGVAAKINGLRIAGKTGTSRKVVEGKYMPGSYTASFVGFFPAQEPQIVCLVMLDNPHEGGYTGGLASAPIFKRIAEKVVATSDRFSGKKHTMLTDKGLIAVPDVSNLKVDAASAILASVGLRSKIHGGGTMVWKQAPPPGTKQSTGTAVTLNTESKVAASQGYTIVPDVRGLTIRRAINRLTTMELIADVNGSGLVVAQGLPPGEQVKAGTRVALRCETRRVSIASLN